MKYPNHSDDYGELIPANVLLRLINLYPDGFDEKLIMKDYDSDHATLLNIINSMNIVAEEFGININNAISQDRCFYPAISITDEPLDWEDNMSMTEYNHIIKSKGYELYYVPYRSCEIRNWWFLIKNCLEV